MSFGLVQPERARPHSFGRIPSGSRSLLFPPLVFTDPAHIPSGSGSPSFPSLVFTDPTQPPHPHPTYPERILLTSVHLRPSRFPLFALANVWPISTCFCFDLAHLTSRIPSGSAPSRFPLSSSRIRLTFPTLTHPERISRIPHLSPRSRAPWFIFMNIPTRFRASPAGHAHPRRIRLSLSPLLDPERILPTLRPERFPRDLSAHVRRRTRLPCAHPPGTLLTRSLVLFSTFSARFRALYLRCWFSPIFERFSARFSNTLLPHLFPFVPFGFRTDSARVLRTLSFISSLFILGTHFHSFIECFVILFVPFVPERFPLASRALFPSFVRFSNIFKLHSLLFVPFAFRTDFARIFRAPLLLTLFWPYFVRVFRSLSERSFSLSCY